MNTKDLKKAIIDGSLDEKFNYVYVDQSLLSLQKNRYIELIDNFASLYGEAREIEVFSAPGRSEVGGNHTDHQHGRVLAASLNLDTIAVVSANDSNIINITSKGFNIKPIDISDLNMQEHEVGRSEGLIRGVCARIKDLGFVIGGFDACMSSEVLEGAGLSSSASFEVLLGTIISGMFNEEAIDAVEIAKIGQYAENHYFLKPCGLMDQMACSVGGFVFIDFKDPEKPIVEKIDFDFSAYQHSLCIVDTLGSHADLTDDYAAIPSEMKEVASFFGKAYLREVKFSDFIANISKIYKHCSGRSVLRAYHFFEEDERVVKEVNALNKEDFNEFKQLIIESGNSSYKYLQNIYSTKDVSQQNISIALAMSEYILEGTGATRVHGGGFAGTIQAFVPEDKLVAYKQLMDELYGDNACHILKIRPCGGIRFI
ncbi:MAG: galactokinase family protein [Erysipelotrichaceae bacterium]